MEGGNKEGDPADDKGMHLIIEAYKCTGPIDSLEVIYSLLEEILKVMNVKQVTKPILVYNKIKRVRDMGITGFISGVFTHAVIHSFPNRRYFFLDIMSFSRFNPDLVMELLKEELPASGYKKSLVNKAFNCNSPRD